MNSSYTPASVVKQAVINLTDAQIKALPTTPRELIPDFNTDAKKYAIDATYVQFILNTAAGAYSNIDAGALFGLAPLSALAQTEFEFMDSGDVADFFGDTVTQIRTLARNDTINYAFRLDDSGLRIVFSNGSAGNLTGGHPDNSLRVVITYSLVPLT